MQFYIILFLHLYVTGKTVKTRQINTYAFSRFGGNILFIVKSFILFLLFSLFSLKVFMDD